MPLATTAISFSSPTEVESRFDIDGEDIGTGGRGLDPRVDVVHCDDVMLHLGFKQKHQVDYDDEKIITIDNFDASTPANDFRCTPHICRGHHGRCRVKKICPV